MKFSIATVDQRNAGEERRISGPASYALGTNGERSGILLLGLEHARYTAKCGSEVSSGISQEASRVNERSVDWELTDDSPAGLDKST